jgi:hypothetical protein
MMSVVETDIPWFPLSESRLQSDARRVSLHSKLSGIMLERATR